MAVIIGAARDSDLPAVLALDLYDGSTAALGETRESESDVIHV
jgi:hypothetical protein